jgi:outer membrane protein assembly factor BamD (BamD/ComL family)
MKKQTEATKAGQQYAAAYAVHYKNKNLNEALDLYEGLMAAHPDTNEAEYSRTPNTKHRQEPGSKAGASGC